MAARAELLDGAFAALADGTRRGVVELLQRGPRRAGELAEALDASAPALSRHLRILRESGLVEELADDTDARVRMFRLRREPFTALRAWVDDVESFWADQLASFARHVQSKERKATPRKNRP